jgi:hypothetical protein
MVYKLMNDKSDEVITCDNIKAIFDSSIIEEWESRKAFITVVKQGENVEFYRYFSNVAKMILFYL